MGQRFEVAPCVRSFVMDKYWIFKLFVGLVCILGYGNSTGQYYENLAHPSHGASCLVGTYSDFYDTDCTNATDGNVMTSYSSYHGNGWLTITLEMVSMVTAIDIVLDSRDDMEYDIDIRQRVIFSDRTEHLIYLRRPQGSDYDFYRQRVLFTEPVMTKSVTISWTADKMAPIADVTVIGNTQGIQEITAASFSCLNSNSDCQSAHDADMMSSLQIVRGNMVEVSFNDTETVDIIALYSTPLIARTTLTPMTITLLDLDRDERGRIDIQYRNQGRDREASWQTVNMGNINMDAAALTIHVARDYATISEVEVYKVTKELLSRSPQAVDDVPYLMSYDADLTIRDMELVIIGDRLSDTNLQMTTAPAALETEMPLGIGISESLFETSDMSPSTPSVTTTSDPHVNITASKDRGPSTVYETESRTVTTNTTYLTTSVPASGFWTLSWYWYVLMGTGAFTLILVMVIIILITRLRSKSYSPRNPGRPRITLRSLGSVGDAADAMSVVTPTRGYYQLTLNSQSSMPLPYTAFSPINTTTFGRKEGQQQGYGFTFEDIGSQSTEQSDGHKPSESEKNGYKLHDGDLSDDCFMD